MFNFGDKIYVYKNIFPNVGLNQKARYTYCFKYVLHVELVLGIDYLTIDYLRCSFDIDGNMTSRLSHILVCVNIE